jgi:hypothetical protein
MESCSFTGYKANRVDRFLFLRQVYAQACAPECSTRRITELQVNKLLCWNNGESSAYPHCQEQRLARERKYPVLFNFYSKKTVLFLRRNDKNG